jgi:hypothetical protein
MYSMGAGMGQFANTTIFGLGLGTLALIGVGAWFLFGRGGGGRRRKLRLIRTKAAYEAAKA